MFISLTILRCIQLHTFFIKCDLLIGSRYRNKKVVIRRDTGNIASISLTVFDIFSILICVGKTISTPILGAFMVKKHPHNGVSHEDSHFLGHFALTLFCVSGLCACQKDNKIIKKSIYSYISSPGRSAVSTPIWSKLGSISTRLNVVTHFWVRCLKSVGMAVGCMRAIQHYYICRLQHGWRCRTATASD